MQTTTNGRMKLTLKDFAELFDTMPDNIPQVCREVISNSDFHYRILFGAEKESVLLRVVKTLVSDSLRISGPHRKRDWEKGWSENLEGFVSKGHDIGELIPKFVRKKRGDQVPGDYIMPDDPNFETNFVSVLRCFLFTKYFADSLKVFEFGCGTGLNLVALARLFPEKEMFGLDWSEASCRIVNELAGRLDINLSGVLFDMFSPNDAVEVDGGSAVFTIGAMEQLGENFKAFAEFLLRKGPSVVINVEVNYELLDQGSLFDYLAAAYMEKRNYLRGFTTYLRERVEQGLVEIIDTRKTFGSLYHDGYTYIVWRPTRAGMNT